MSLVRWTEPNFKPPKVKNGTPAGRRHMACVKMLPCVICGHAPPSAAHHCISDRFSQRKSSDFETIPLCWECHQGPHGIHAGKAEWEARNGKDYEFLPVVADQLAGEWNP